MEPYNSWHGPQYNVIPKVTRVKPEEASAEGYIFTEKNGVVVIEAEHYFRSIANEKTRWTIIPGLGRTLSGVALMPYTEQTNGTSIHYKMKLNSNADSVKVRLFFGSTMPFIKGGHNVAVSFEGCTEKILNINEDLTWKNCYTKMYPTGASRIIEKEVIIPLPKNKDGIVTLTICPFNPGIVFNKLIIDDGGYENTYLKMTESPYMKY